MGAFASAVMVQPGVRWRPLPQKAAKWAMVMHGGAGVIERKSMTPELDKAYRAGLKEAIQAAAELR